MNAPGPRYGLSRIMRACDPDIASRSAQQAALLRRRAAGELANDAGLDWGTIADEIESVGRGQFRAVRSLLIQAFGNELKAQAWPQWRGAG